MNNRIFSKTSPDKLTKFLRVLVLGLFVGVVTLTVRLHSATATPPVSTNTSTSQAVTSIYPSDQGLVWTQEEIAKMPKMTLLNVGQSVKLTLATTTNTPLTEGVWSAEYGVITSDGVYTAPTHVPPRGLETVKFVRNSGDVITTLICVVPSADIPGSENTVSITSPVSLGANPITSPCEVLANCTSSLVSPSTQSSVGVSTQSPVAIPMADTTNGPVLTLGPDDSAPQMLKVINTQVIPAVQIGNITAFPLAYKSTLTTSQYNLYAQSTNGTPLYDGRMEPTVTQDMIVTNLAVCAVPIDTAAAPVAPGSPNPSPTPCPKCINGSKRWNPVGKPEVMQIGKDGPTVSNKYKVDAQMAGQISTIYKIAISVGTEVNINYYRTSWQVNQLFHLYVCKNGKWVYDHTEKCVRYGTSVTTVPLWGCLLLGYPPGNGILWDIDQYCSPV
jgi:hypothetical protein